MEGPALPDPEQPRTLLNFEHQCSYSPGDFSLASVSISETFQNACYCMGIVDDKTVGRVQSENMNVRVI